MGGQQRHSSEGGRRRRAAPLFAALLLCACGSEDDFDWCAEAQDQDAVPATGSLTIDYDGFFAKGPVSITPYVKHPARDVLIVEGCGTDARGNLWRLFGGWSVPDDAVLPVELQPESTTGAACNAELLVCQDANCVGDHKARIMQQSVFASGMVQSFAPDEGTFASDARFRNGLDEEIRVQADLHWTPAGG